MSEDTLKLDTPAYGKQVIKAFGQCETVMTASRAAGYQFEFGTKTTLRHYMKWRRDNPTFRVTSYVNQHSKQKANGAKGHSQRPSGRRGGNVRNHDEQ